MKKLVGFTFLLIFIFSAFLFYGCSLSISQDNTEYLRIHIRANSNTEIDQNIKYQIKDDILDYLTPLIAACSSKEEMEQVIERNISNVNSLCNSILAKNGLNYTASSKVRNEYFPTRSYGELTLEQGYYDALIIELGEGEGNNWWCVVYPPLCFVNAKEIDGKNFRYKSKIMELIKG